MDCGRLPKKNKSKQYYQAPIQRCHWCFGRKIITGIYLCTPLAGMCTKVVQNIPNPKFWPQISVFQI